MEALRSRQQPRSSLTLVWLAVAFSSLLVGALFFSGRGALLRLAIPAAATLVGLALYFKRPVAFIHFTLWTWFLTPLVRRVVDWRVGFEDHNLVLIAPLLVSCLSGLTLLRKRRPSPTPLRLTPFFLCVAAIAYGAAVGLIRWRLHASEAGSPGEIAYAVLDWVAPLLFGLHLYIRWPMYDEHRNAIQKSFFWAVIVLGIYGVYQYVRPPDWDTLWLRHMMADLDNQSFGRPEPFEIRVWSTLNSPGVFANAMMTGLLLLFCTRSRLKPLAMGAGYSSFLLSLVRTSWLGWLVGLAVFSRGSKTRHMPRLLLSLVLVPIVVSPLMLNQRIATMVQERIQTLQHTGEDDSVHDRMDEYHALLSSLASDPFGEGLSHAEAAHGYMMDSGIIRMLYYFGWLGAMLFLAGIAAALRTMSSKPDTADLEAAVFRAVLVALIFELLSGNTLVGASGVIVWTCIGMGLNLQHAQERASVSAPSFDVLPPEVSLGGLAVPVWRKQQETNL